RKDKYTHAAASILVRGIAGIALPQAALMCNFPDPKEGSALMEYLEVETLFHEFGHLLHAMFMGHGRWIKNTDDGIEWDFIEAPSQMLEEWIRDPETLRRFAHLNGYSAIYYTYMWSLVIAKVLFSKFQEGGTILDPKVARRYRETNLAPGSRKPAAELIEDFLGRPLSFDAFENWLNREGR